MGGEGGQLLSEDSPQTRISHTKSQKTFDGSRRQGSDGRGSAEESDESAIIVWSPQRDSGRRFDHCEMERLAILRD